MFKQRSHTKEMLDDPSIPAEQLALNLRELHTINSWLGGYSTSMSALKKVLSPKKPSVVVDIGSGGGDAAMRLSKWSRAKSYNIQIKGIDLNQFCVSYSTQRCEGLAGVHFICDDYRNVQNHVPEIDVLHASLFCHHLTDEEIIDLLSFARTNKITLVINDLARNAFAYYGIRLLTRLFSRSQLVKNDAPLSVLRGFTKAEWVQLLQKAEIKKYSIAGRWAFRHQIIVYND